MKKSNKALVRNALVSYIQREIGECLDIAARNRKYGSRDGRYMHFGIGTVGNLWITYVVNNAPKQELAEHILYLGTVDLNDVCESEIPDDEYTEFQPKIESFIDSILAD